MSKHIDTAAAFAETFDVSRETVERLEIYADLLATWQRAVNLVAPGTLPEVWHRHFADSAQLLAFAPADVCHWLDLGSGAGFPGLVVAILLADPRKGAKVTLVESDVRKGAFLREVARQTEAPVEILSTRIEKLPTQNSIGRVDVVSARALAPMARLIELAEPFMDDQTVGLFPKGREAEVEVRDGLDASRFVCRLVPSLTDDQGRIAIVRRIPGKQEG